ncbi:hypothetical protein ACW0KB_09640 [Virgibacillus salarius]
MKTVGFIELGKLLKLTEVVINKGIEEVQNIVAIVRRYWTEKKTEKEEIQRIISWFRPLCCAFFINKR